jgi:plasmid stabilization system protein ParE
VTVHFHPAARAELQDALRWYEERSPVAAMAFASEVESAIHRFADKPLHFPAAEHGTRRCLLRRFPYSVFYKIRQDSVMVIAVAHQKRRPVYWRDR